MQPVALTFLALTTFHTGNLTRRNHDQLLNKQSHICYQNMPSETPSETPSSAPHSPGILTRQPLKRIWTIGTIAFLPARVLLILIYNIFRSLRAHPDWTYHQAVGKSIFAIWWKYASTVEFHPFKTLDPGSDGSRFIVMPPAASSFYRGVLANDAAVKPVTIGGMWYPRPYNPSTDAGKKIAIHFHGGAYVLGGCRPMEGGWGPEMFARKASGFSLMPQYRLASDRNTCFPAAVQDGLTAYMYLLEQGVSARDVVVSGDSAGANLAVALVRYLTKEKESLPLPRAAFWWGPWLDLRTPPEVFEAHRKSRTDYIPSSLIEWGVRMYVPPQIGVSDAYISPLGNEFQTPVPMFLQTGSAEVMYEEHVRFVKAMREIKGNVVELEVIENAPHDTFAAGQVLGFEKEAEDAVTKAIRFMTYNS